MGPSKKVHNSRYNIASYNISIIMPGDYKMICIKQVFHFNNIHNINELLLYTFPVVLGSTLNFTIRCCKISSFPKIAAS